MRLTLQYIIGALIGGAVSGLFFYALGIHEGKQQAALKAAQAVSQAIQNRAGINETINNMDGFRKILPAYRRVSIVHVRNKYFSIFPFL